MSLPPEQINIKRRREEEPVDTLYIQSELHQTKRRFTDFVFQRVQIRSGDGNKGSLSPSPAQRDLRSPRSVSSAFPGSSHSRTAASGDTGVPLVRATSPGAEFREAKRLAAVRREKEEQLKRALHSSPSSTKSAGPGRSAGDGDTEPAATTATSSGRSSPAPSASPGMRRFQISRSKSLLRGTAAGAGVQKRKGDGAIAVLVEKLRRKPHSRQASMVADAAVRAEDVRGSSDVAATKTTDSRDSSMLHEDAPTAARPRKRPVVNKAERQWREERKTAIDAAKRNINQVLEKEAQTQHQSNWDDESERLAREFEQIALEMEGAMEEDTEDVMPAPTSTQGRSAPVMPKPPLRYLPRTPNKLRAGKSAELPQGGEEPVKAPVAATAEEVEHEEDSDGEYVYDTYIRKPLPEGGIGDGDIRDKGGDLLTNPLADWQQNQDAWFRQKGIDTTRADVGVIIITQEDEEYWEHFVEEDDDEDRWDSEDGDSNAENNPANEYPDEDLSWDDEDDDPMAIYHKYRHHAVSDDEEFDMNDSASERAFGYSGHRSHVESDDESW
ncbi:uncharacterized protein LDX57_012438 [Aspergillus melleus]|uniref:uncharacterized protein n=1 Tax=Aspergillus melleus TaxID=138277 RepID=UPI001E8CE7AB|nr:uncharacterized protein LDX57_012438 [Aspergillus melleus]KAH8434805.1 hypothetical protein LDX57_012438 [Aspergillus melleus]